MFGFPPNKASRVTEKVRRSGPRAGFTARGASGCGILTAPHPRSFRSTAILSNSAAARATGCTSCTRCALPSQRAHAARLTSLSTALQRSIDAERALAQNGHILEGDIMIGAGSRAHACDTHARPRTGVLRADARALQQATRDESFLARDEFDRSRASDYSLHSTPRLARNRRPRAQTDLNDLDMELVSVRLRTQPRARMCAQRVRTHAGGVQVKPRKSVCARVMEVVFDW